MDHNQLVDLQLQVDQRVAELRSMMEQLLDGYESSVAETQLINALDFYYRTYVEARPGGR